MVSFEKHQVDFGEQRYSMLQRSYRGNQVGRGVGKGRSTTHGCPCSHVRMDNGVHGTGGCPMSIRAEVGYISARSFGQALHIPLFMQIHQSRNSAKPQRNYKPILKKNCTRARFQKITSALRQCEDARYANEKTSPPSKSSSTVHRETFFCGKNLCGGEPRNGPIFTF